MIWKSSIMVVLLSALPAASSSAYRPDVIRLDPFRGRQFTVQASVCGRPRTVLFDTGGGVTTGVPGDDYGWEYRHAVDART